MLLIQKSKPLWIFSPKDKVYDLIGEEVQKANILKTAPNTKPLLGILILNPINDFLREIYNNQRMKLETIKSLNLPKIYDQYIISLCTE